ncbi:DNA-binding protein [Oerskovia turbata]|uniref:DNA-binding protein n=1 Tax=Oerskovia turbata TaxID=1713 RepID=A0A4Q1KQK6_9CELL|nr:Rv2175c family DNA-binding protein [Oerskovia turbata]RXR23155.1 DNA-binding protein [Oerskovia turbata]RXR31895.1 DNA-binding protein [Oerskovia turbata]TGJ97177.1 DNA-binding protein [Actinotalea fermentans ATCC 43279 = JCM 9966 = DSM 3133]TGJ97180.1 DNA-binding protein [Actinotalea fermentans ATCC 43279 = JCM 9966 = DSM 3133]
MTDVTDLEQLVTEWLTLPDLAEVLGTDMTQARKIAQDRRVVGVKRGERSSFQVPAAFVVPAHLANPANAKPAPENPDEGRQVVLMSLQGTIALLTDFGFSDVEILEWLFSPDEALGTTPMAALRAGRKAEVRRVAQALL